MIAFYISCLVCWILIMCIKERKKLLGGLYFWVLEIMGTLRADEQLRVSGYFFTRMKEFIRTFVV